MDINILDEGKKFLISYLKGKKIGYETIHSWRRSWEFVILHSLRVEGYVEKIIDGENHKLTEEEVLTLRLSAILHDIGRMNKKEGHALVGRNIVKDWLNSNQTVLESIGDPDKLLLLIEKHSDKEVYESDFCLNVLRDADVLDEVGVMSIFMTSNWIDRSNPYFFEFLSDRIENYEIGFCDKGFGLLNTETSKIILDKKRKFITQFSSQLKDELYGTEMFGEYKIEDYYTDLI